MRVQSGVVRHRHSPTDLKATPLGRAILFRGYSIAEVAKGTGIDRYTLQDYLNKRAPRSDGGSRHANGSALITARHLGRLSMFLKVRAADLQHR